MKRALKVFHDVLKFKILPRLNKVSDRVRSKAWTAAKLSALLKDLKTICSKFYMILEGGKWTKENFASRDIEGSIKIAAVSLLPHYLIMNKQNACRDWKINYLFIFTSVHDAAKAREKKLMAL